MSNKRTIHYLLWGLLIVGMLTELAFQTFWQNSLGPYISPVIWIIAGILIAFCGFGLMQLNQESETSTDRLFQITPNRKYLVFLTLFTVGAIGCGFFLADIFAEIPVDPKRSDIIPSLEFYVRRLLSGEVVYRPLPFDGYSVNPTYFPMLWSPYIFSELLQIDYRWTSYGVFLIGLFIYQLKLAQQELPLVEWLIKIAVPFVWIIVFTQFARGTFGMAVELLPVGFYLLLTLSVFHRKPWFMALGILLCLLSRYAFTFWLPVYLLIYWIENGFWKVFRVSLYVLVGVIGLYVLPFLSKDWTIFTKGLAYYEKTAMDQWMPQTWQQEGDAPHHLYKGLSLAAYFYEHTEYTVEDRLSRNRKFHITACAFMALLILLGYFYFRKQGLNTRLYLIIALKLYLTIFYGLFYVPFSYLFQLPLFLSIPILYQLRIVPKLKP